MNGKLGWALAGTVTEAEETFDIAGVGREQSR
jgi:hypothetical protein